MDLLLLDNKTALLTKPQALLIGKLDDQEKLDQQKHFVLKSSKVQKVLTTFLQKVGPLVREEAFSVNLEDDATQKFANFLTASRYKDYFLLHLRLHVKNEGETNHHPTRKGVCFTLIQFWSLLKALPAAYLKTLNLSSDALQLIQKMADQAKKAVTIKTQVEDIPTLILRTKETVTCEEDMLFFFKHRNTTLHTLVLLHLSVLKLTHEMKRKEEEEETDDGEEESFDCSFGFYGDRKPY